jgi:DNA recombination protein RmuC
MLTHLLLSSLSLLLGIIVSSVILLRKNLINVRLLDNLKYKIKLTENTLIEKEDLCLSLSKQKEDLLSEVNNFKEENSLLTYQLSNFKEQQQSKDQLYKEFKHDFSNIAQEIIKENNHSLINNNKNELDKVIAPFKNKIGEFEAQVKDCYEKELKEKLTLKSEIEKLLEMNCKLSIEAANLSNALKGDNKIQGNWGEMILEKILQRSGLEKNLEYKIQEVSQNNQGDKIQPDVIIYLPEKKHIIIDSKVSLKSYDYFVNSDNDIDKKAYLKAHLKSLKNHIEVLSNKSYHSSDKHNSLDFVLMFVPIESSYLVALQADQDLFWYGWDRKILIVSPSTLHSTLKIIVALWKQEKQAKNVQEIAKLSGALYDKFIGFLEDMHKISRSISQSEQSFNNAMQKLSHGKGSIQSKLEKMKLLGAKTSKSITVTQ